MSEVQEGAQLLAGKDFPTAIFTGIIEKSKLKGKVLGVLNTTPYDTWLETTAMDWSKDHPGSVAMKSLSIAECKTSGVVDYCEKVIAMKLLEALIRSVSCVFAFDGRP